VNNTLSDTDGAQVPMHNAHWKLYAKSQHDVFLLVAAVLLGREAACHQPGRIILLSHFAGFVWVTNVHSCAAFSGTTPERFVMPGLSHAHARRHTHNTPTLHICHSVPCTTLHMRHTQGLVSTNSNQQKSLLGWPCCFLANAAVIKTTPSRSCQAGRGLEGGGGDEHLPSTMLHTHAHM
jgi:hypothetical protein